LFINTAFYLLFLKLPTLSAIFQTRLEYSISDLFGSKSIVTDMSPSNGAAALLQGLEIAVAVH
jgi:hypothetical protein